MRSITRLVLPVLAPCLLAVLLLASACSGPAKGPSGANDANGANGATGDAAPATQATPAEATLTLKVAGMTCSGCEQTIAGEVGKLAGVTKVKADHKAGTTVVTYDPAKADLAEVRKAIEKVGYKIEG